MSSAAIPQADPRAGYLELKPDIDAAIGRALASGRYILGDEVAAFEREFAAYVGARDVVGVASGTDALVLALRAVGVVPGDTVATVSHTAVATVAAIELAGARPLLLDVGPRDFTLDVEEFARLLSAGTQIRAVVPVHLYGQAARLDELLPLARRHGVAVIEDCAQAHGATLSGKRLGSLGDAGCFSFYPTKNLGALGDGGAVVASDERLSRRLRELREYGWRERYISAIPGQNSRLDEVQAALLRVKLARLDGDNQRRQAIATRYDAALAASSLTVPYRRPGASHVFHQYVVQTERRDSIRQALTAAAVGTAVHYPVPVHRQPAYAGRVALGPSGLRHSETLASRILSLPMFPQLPATAVERTIAELRRAAN
jgi:dTDP-4-amino-4,6-dideoxygalactose transaminase